MSKPKGFSAKVRATVLARDQWRCAWCGDGLDGTSELHHRRPRGMGSSRLPWVNLAGNGVYLHARCHTVVESQRAGAIEDGFLVSMNGVAVSSEVPIRHAVHGRCLLGDDGSVNKS